MHLTSPYLVQGVIIGIAISLSIGPIALITIKRTAQYGLKAGVISGITIALIDTIMAMLILFGLSHSRSLFFHVPKEIHTILAACVFMYGVTLFNKKPALESVAVPIEKHFTETLLACLINPSTYISFGVISLLLTRFIGQPIFNRTEVLIGFFLGAVLWWTILVLLSFRHRHHVSALQLQKVVGILIIILSVLMLISPNSSEHFPMVSKFLSK